VQQLSPRAVAAMLRMSAGKDGMSLAVINTARGMFGSTQQFSLAPCVSMTTKMMIWHERASHRF
jgi:hypothetical protein